MINSTLSGFRCFTGMLAIRLVLAAFLIVIFSAEADAQGPGGILTGETATPMPGAGHDYNHLLAETVDPSSGSVNLNIAFPVPRARGITLPVTYSYSSAGVYHFSQTVTNAIIWAANANDNLGNLGPCEQGGGVNCVGGWMTPPQPTLTYSSWNYLAHQSGSTSGALCQYFSNIAFLDANGGSHSLGMGLGLSLSGNGFNTIDPNICYDSSGNGATISSNTGDDRYTGAFANTHIYGGGVASYYISNGDVWVTDNADGTACYFPTNGIFQGNGSGSGSVQATLIEDRNGNVVNLASGSMIDTAGREEIGSLIGGVDYTFKWTTTTASYAAPSKLTVSAGGSQCQSVPSGGWQVSGTQTVLSSIGLPNSTSYQFFYGETNPNDSSIVNPYGLINEIVYPDGGWVKYKWTMNVTGSYTELSTINSSTVNNPAIYGEPGQCQYQYPTPVLATRTVSYDGTNIAQTQAFSYATVWPAPVSSNYPAQGDWTSKSASVTTTDNIAGASFLKTYSYLPVALGRPPFVGSIYAGQVPVEQTITTYAGSTTSTGSLDTKSEAWFDQFTKACEFHTNSAGMVSGHFYQYVNGPQISDDKEYSFGQIGSPSTVCSGKGPTAPSGVIPARETVTSYQMAAANVPCRVVVLDATGTHKASETDYYYDGGTTLCTASPGTATQLVSGLPAKPITHDETKYAPSSAALRGNLTRQVRINFTGSATTSYAYDETGQVVSMTDPCGNSACSDMSGAASHTTTYVYADSPAGGNSAGNSNAYLTQVTYPAPNSATHTEKYKYTYPSGQLVEADDQNALATTYSYEDPLLRLTDIYAPASAQNGGARPHINYAFADGTSPSVTATNPIGVSSKSIYDGLGHVVQTQQSDPAGVDYVNTTYDGLGRVYTVTNPFRGTYSSAVGQSIYKYDSLNRNTLRTNADSTTESWTYNGNVVTFKDENSHQWQRTSDAFGRLTQVLEPNGSAATPSMETDYGYDALNNLLSVKQLGGPAGSPAPNGAIQRSFAYDQVSRLLASSNPETASAANPPSLTCSGATGIQWTTCYRYDVNGNLSSKGDNRLVTATYSYDSLNRLLSKSYSSNANGTPLSCYQYDSSSVTNGIGRLASSWTQSASTATCSTAAAFRTKRSILLYDEVGRVTSEQQYTPASVKSGTSYPPAYNYDLAGNLHTSTDGTTPSPTTPGAKLTLTIAPDSAGRLQTMTSNWSDAAHPGTLFSAHTLPSTPPCAGSSTASYSPSGGLWNATFGTDLTLNRAYDVRLRISCESDTGTGTSIATAGSATVTITGVEQSK